MPRATTPHIIRDVDTLTRTGTCAVCGRVKLFSRGSGRWRCGQAHADSKKATRIRSAELAGTALKVATPCCGRRRVTPPLRYPNAKTLTVELVPVECSCGRVYGMVRLHRPAEYLALQYPEGYEDQAADSDELIWSAGFASYNGGEPDVDVGFMFDDQPSLGGVLDAPRLRDSLANWVFEGPFDQHWSNPAAWERHPVTD
jgi:hypothetical protein